MPDNNQAEEQYEPAGEMVLNNLDTLKALADPFRIQIIELFLNGPRTVKQLAAELNTTPTKLYYHINLMEEHGILKVVSTRVVSGIIEKQYHLVAYSFRPDPALFSPSGEMFEEGVPLLVSTLLEHTRRDIMRGIKVGLIDPTKGDDDHRTTIIANNLLLLSEDQAHSFIRRLADLMKEFGSLESSEPGTRVYGMMLAVYPTIHTSLPKTKEEGEGTNE